MSCYHETYAAWRKNPGAFWAEAAGAIDWVKPWDKVYARIDGLDRWFVGAECNTCWNAVDRHVMARAATRRGWRRKTGPPATSAGGMRVLFPEPGGAVTTSRR